MSDVHDAARRLEPLFSGNPHVDWDNANRDVVADLVTLARDWFERRGQRTKMPPGELPVSPDGTFTNGGRN